jgi:hypothetical protein
MTITEIIAAAGGPTAVGRTIGRHHTSVMGWRRVPAEHARPVAKLANLHVSVVRPDLFDPPEPATKSDQQAAA